jgi:UDP-GlcNAc:undecaprenyl-phosphate GlcNAc-1-phosphate transferase
MDTSGGGALFREPHRFFLTPPAPMIDSSPLLRILLALAVAFGLGTLGTFLTREVARRIGFVAKPRAERWHAKPTALAGGVGIFVAFAVTFVWVGGPLRVPLLAGATAMFVLGLIDDIVQLRPLWKLGGQLLVAVLTAVLGPTLPWTPFAPVNQAITVFWLVGVTNALNLLDNMDGLSGGVACIGAMVQAYFFFSQGQATEAAVCMALAGALMGFLLFNFNPASIFMGDAGALFLGYTLATLALHQSYGRSRGLVTTIAGPVLLLLIPIFDTTFVSITRTLRGRPISQGGRDHTSHRLVLLGLSERAAVLTLWGLALFSGLIGILLRHSVVYALFLGIPVVLVVLVMVGVHLARLDRHEMGQGRGRSLLALGALGYRLRLFEAMFDILLAFVSLGGAFLLRFDGNLPADIEQKLYNVFPVLVATKLLALYLSGAYDGLWRHAGTRDLVTLARGAFLGSLAGIAVVSMMVGFRSLSRGALVLDAILFTTLALCARLAFRSLQRSSETARELTGKRRVLLWGVHENSAIVVNQLAHGEGMEPVGFLDDSELTRGCTLHGLPVLGGYEEAAVLLGSGVADEILIASPSPPAERVQQVVTAVGQERVRQIRVVIEPVTPPSKG